MVPAMEIFKSLLQIGWSINAKISVLTYSKIKRMAVMRAKIRFDFFIKIPFYQCEIVRLNLLYRKKYLIAISDLRTCKYVI